MLDDAPALLEEAMARFDALWKEARACAPWEPDAMSLATADAEGRPGLRTVLLKEANARGFVFYTNYESRKGRELAANPHAALCFFWRSLRRQVVVEGTVERLAEARSDAYFATRARPAQLGAWASEQSRPLVDRAALQARVEKLDRTYAGRDIPRPPHWGGFLLVPDLIEFWTPHEGRLNQRERYTRDAAGNWSVGLINP
ncbi:MAG: pyridoxamine 5'-phosphate oxidase [Gammaproteobacteria bacterium]|nr:pyridoxamine 5'-phosphate oxidase [Gammaproteobacteria bacterium]